MIILNQFLKCSKIETHKQRKGFSDDAENVAIGIEIFISKKQTLHLTLPVECSVLYFIGTGFRFMMSGKLNWFSTGETSLKFELKELEKVSLVAFRQEKIAHIQPNEKLLVF